MVAAPPGGVLGFLPKGISHHLAPLLKSGLLSSHATVARLGATNSAAIDVLLEASFHGL